MEIFKCVFYDFFFKYLNQHTLLNTVCDKGWSIPEKNTNNIIFNIKYMPIYVW